MVTDIEATDLAVSDAVADERHRPAVRIIGKLSEVADQPPLIALTWGTAAVGLAMRDARLVRAGLRMGAAHALATWIKGEVKSRVDRSRPDHAMKAGYRAEAGHSDAHELSSFPSGHTAGAVAVSQALARDYPAASVAARLATVAVAAIQIPRCKHFVSDIAAGALIGWVAEKAVSSALDAVWTDASDS